MNNPSDPGREAREFLVEKFIPVLAQMTFSRVYFAGHLPTLPPPAKNYPQTRIEIPLTGEKPITFASGGDARKIMLHPGELFYSEKNCRARSHWDVAHQMLSIVFANGNDYIRFLYIDCDGSREPATPDVWYHTGRGLDGPGIHLVQALNLLARHDEAGVRPEAREILVALIRMAANILAHDRPERQSKAQRTFINARQYLIEHCHHAGISREQVATALKLNPGYLSRLFKSFTGHNFNEIMMEQRLIRAEQMLKDQSLSVNEIAADCGFADPGYFIKMFKRHFGSTPGKYRPRQN